RPPPPANSSVTTVSSRCTCWKQPESPPFMVVLMAPRRTSAFPSPPPTSSSNRPAKGSVGPVPPSPDAITPFHCPDPYLRRTNATMELITTIDRPEPHIIDQLSKYGSA